MKIFLSAVVIVLEWFIQTLPIQNSAGVAQIQDTATSSSYVHFVSALVTLSPIVMIAIIGLIWKSEIIKLFKKN
jgi:hypothetical protein